MVVNGGDFESGGPFPSTSSSGMMCPSEPQSQVDDDEEPSGGGQPSTWSAREPSLTLMGIRTPMRQLSFAKMRLRRQKLGSVMSSSSSTASGVGAQVCNNNDSKSNHGGSDREQSSSVEAVAAVKQMVISQIDKKLKDLREDAKTRYRE